jgi:hypothetical protein
VSGDQCTATRNVEERNGLQTTMQMQAQASQNLSDDEGVLVNRQEPIGPGALQVMQAMNQRPCRAVLSDAAADHLGSGGRWSWHAGALSNGPRGDTALSW